MACTCQFALSALRQPTRRIARPTAALLRTFSSSPSALAAPSASGAKAATAAAAPPPSACPAGTVLKGLNYLKDGQDPVALEDSEYPPWVWTLLNSNAGEKTGQDDAAAALRKQRADLKKKAKAGIKAANDLKG
ncbi:hypothetical protein JCM10450v2_006944 [Rhodotorula kratochvilovae]